MTGRTIRFRSAKTFLGGLVAACICAGSALAQASPFAPGWLLQPDQSALRFQSVKNTTKVESSSFATFTGTIDPDGHAEVKVLMDSVDTKIDLRNVRMRFLFFETFQYPEATVSLKIDPATVSDLPQVRRKVLDLPFTLTMHGVKKDMQAEIAVTLLSDDLVSVASATPISIAVADFGLEGGITKLQEAANVEIIPSATVTFDFLFARQGTGEAVTVAAADPATVPAAETAALETRGDFSIDECKGRFEILSRTDNIYFRAGSATLDSASAPLLNGIADIVRRCPGLTIEISGHTDSDGGTVTNQRLSEARAGAVTNYLAQSGIAADRMVTVGYGETRPVAPNDTPQNKRRNRRIEFTAVDG